MKKKILVALPAYNEEKQIGDVIQNIIKHGFENILVVDDGSTDKTVAVSRRADAQVISHFKNSGLGVSLRTALKYAKKFDFDVLVTMDSDGQHDACDINAIIKPILDANADIVIGVRNFNNKNVPFVRRLILKLSNVYTWMLFGVWSRDSQSGFRAFSRRAIEMIVLRSERMEVSSEIFSEINKKQMKFNEVPIKVIYTPYSLQKGQRNSNLFNVSFKLFVKMFR
jgi:glycosyltransferase involved in cell wall biosynthesis